MDPTGDSSSSTQAASARSRFAPFGPEAGSGEPRPSRRIPGTRWLTRAVGIRETLIVLASVAIAIFGALGFTVKGPANQIRAVSVHVDSVTLRLEGQIDQTNRRAAVEDTVVQKLQRRVDTLFTGQAFTNYLLCVQIRRNDPASLPPDCAPAERTWAARRGR